MHTGSLVLLHLWDTHKKCNKMVRLLNIKVLSIQHDFEKDYSILSAPTVLSEFTVEHGIEDANMVVFTTTYSLSNISQEPIFMVQAQSSYSVDESKSAFYEKKNTLVELLCTLAIHSLDHCFGVYSVAIIGFPIASTNLLQLIHPNEFLDTIRDQLDNLNNTDNR